MSERPTEQVVVTVILGATYGAVAQEVAIAEALMRPEQAAVAIEYLSAHAEQ